MPKITSERIIDANVGAYAPGTAGLLSGWRTGSVSSGISSHVLATTTGLGDYHVVSGLTARQVLRATGATTAAFGAIEDADLPSTIVRTSRALTAGAGMTGTGTLASDVTFAVGAGTMITVNADDVAITAGANYQFIGTGSGTAPGWRNVSELAGSGLTAATGVIAVGVSGLGLSVGADAVTLTSSSNPGAAASILATDVNGGLSLSGEFALLNASNAVLKMTATSGSGRTYGLESYQDGKWYFTDFTATATRLLIDANGNVGIGMTSPAYKLDVSGDIRATGDVYVDGGRVDFGTNYLDEDSTWFQLYGSKPMSFNQNIQVAGYASQTTGWRISSLGEADFRYLFVDEMHAKAFIADLEQALAGGQIIAKSVAQLHSTFTAPAPGGDAYLYVNDLPSAPGMQVFQTGDRIRLRIFDRTGGALSITDCWGVVSYPDTTTYDGYQFWLFSRSAAPNAGEMAEGATVAPEAIVLDYGTPGNGIYEVNAIDGIYALNSPYAQVATWATHPKTMTVRSRWGNLRGIFSVDNEYGLYAGSGTAVTDRYIRASSETVELRNVPLALYDGGSNTMLLSAGSSNNSPFMALGATLPTGPITNDGIWMGLEGSAYMFRVGTVGGSELTNGILWNGSTLYLGNTSAEHIWMDGATLKLRNVTTDLLTLAASVLTVGDSSNEHVVVDTSGVSLKDGSTVYGQFAATTIIGLSSANHIEITSTTLKIKAGATEKISMDSGGNASITGVLTIGADGNITASGTVINSTGISMTMPSAWTPANALKFVESTTIGASLNVYKSTGAIITTLNANRSGDSGAVPYSALNGQVFVSSYSETGFSQTNISAINLNSGGSLVRQAVISLYATSATESITLTGATAVTGTLSATGAITQNGSQVWHAGNLTPGDYSLTSHNHSGVYAAASHTHAFGDITGNGNISTSGTLSAGADADTTHILGRAKVGSPATDTAYFSHYDRLSTTDYALAQTAAGTTVVNAASGQTVQMRVNNHATNGIKWDGTAFTLTGAYIDIVELSSAPGNPASGTARMYVTNVGDGRRQLTAKFADGSVVNFAVSTGTA